jgi:hypothetical protein
MDGACSLHGRQVKYIENIGKISREERTTLETPVNLRIILKLILQNSIEECEVESCYMIATGGWLFWKR